MMPGWTGGIAPQEQSDAEQKKLIEKRETAMLLEEKKLLERQEGLQREADAVYRKLNLAERLSAFGTPVRVGSSVLGLMVWRDLDVTVVCSRFSLGRVACLYAELLVEAGVRELRFRNDTGSFNTDLRYPDGLYLGMEYLFENGKMWKLDIWFVEEGERQPDLKHLKEFPPMITPEKRLSILRVKREWAEKPEYRKTVTSYQIYDAVLLHDINTPEEFARWRNTRTIE